MKKIAIIVPANLFRAPYINYYKNIFEKKYKVDLISWNKEGVKEEGIQFDKVIGNRVGVLKKIFYYIKFKKFIINYLRRERYDYIVVHTIQLGIFLEKFLLKEYKEKYICDIRDYTKMIKLRKRLEKLLKNSKYNFISSEGFKKWLPQNYKYYISHNLDMDVFKSLEIKSKLEKKEKYIISTIGTLRDEKVLLQLIKNLKNNSKYEIRCYGDGLSEKRVNILKKNKIYFHGKYIKEEEINFYQESDIINILLSDNINSRTLMPNRFYISLLTGKIMLAYSDTLVGEIIKKYYLGVVIDRKTRDNYAEIIEEYMKSFLYEKFLENKIKYIKKVCLEQETFFKLLSEL
ncbi:hypothetical protein H9X75_06345 [Fusobacterium mortiferum]|uniref:hypothetical protein n=1 Tax=Fusobacterium mortiferum TaxID=850 RepID=UPI001959D42C|nr:hypothetical protein [Fusobacterium mortiferum]